MSDKKRRILTALTVASAMTMAGGMTAYAAEEEIAEPTTEVIAEAPAEAAAEDEKAAPAEAAPAHDAKEVFDVEVPAEKPVKPEEKEAPVAPEKPEEKEAPVAPVKPEEPVVEINADDKDTEFKTKDAPVEIKLDEKKPVEASEETWGMKLYKNAFDWNRFKKNDDKALVLDDINVQDDASWNYFVA